MDLPFRAEYAKSGRASCKGCKMPIPQGALRLAILVQSPFFDGKQPNWHHFECFFEKARVKTVDDIEHFESIRVGDQDKIKEHVGAAAAVILPDKKGKKRTADKTEKAAKEAALKDFTIEYSKSGRAICRGCEQKILKDEIRISKKDFNTDIGKKYGGQDMWHHVNCFVQLRSELGYFESANKIPGFKSLSKEDQAVVLKECPAIKQENIPEVKKVKVEDDPIDKESREQNKIIFAFRDALDKNLKKNELIELLQFNNQEVPSGVDRILDRLSDAMAFGALKPCKACKGGQLVFKKFGYMCTSPLNEWTKCSNTTKDPERGPFKVPKEFKEVYPFLKKYKYVARKRVFKDIHPSVVKTEAKDEVDAEPKVKRALPALYNMEFVILGTPSRGKDVLKKQIQALGGKVVTKITKSVMAVISTKEMVEKGGARIQEAETEQVQVIPEDFVDEAKENVGKIPDLIIKKSICNWGSDPTTRLPAEPSSSRSISKSRSIYTKSVPSKLKMTLKGGGAVDPDSKLQDVAHVYQEGDEKFNAILTKTDVQQNQNSYYKLQLLKSDRGDRYWLFKAWGRIGTTIGGNRVVDKPTLYDAKKEFCALYEEKTGNMWDERDSFQKLPGRFHPVDVDYGESKQNFNIVESKSNLPVPVQSLMKMIFDVKQMEKLMLEFEIDTEQMPLGKLSEKQIHSAFAVLADLQKVIEKGGQEAQFIELTNKFYTFIPHNFGVDEIQIIRNADVVKQKLEMLDSLMELEIAYNLMKSSGSEHTVDSYYKQLNTEIGVLPKDSDEFKIIQEYVKNTHAATHSNYSLEIQDVYQIKRQGEDRRFKPFKKLHNHKLLWHGSRVTNFAGILSQGLRIAPPEAPVTGYMFGKGIYFADMVSKSANYCCTSPTNPTGLLMLCDVALGNMYEKLQADSNIVKAPKGYHSVKGVGRTQPDPNVAKEVDGIQVPLGPGVSAGKVETSLLYNEYIVYDVAQVNTKYLLKVNFKYKY